MVCSSNSSISTYKHVNERIVIIAVVNMEYWCMHISVCLCAYIYMCVYVHACLCVGGDYNSRLLAIFPSKAVELPVTFCLPRHAHRRTQTHALRACMHTHTHTHKHTHTYAYVHMLVHADMHALTHAHTEVIITLPDICRDKFKVNWHSI